MARIKVSVGAKVRQVAARVRSEVRALRNALGWALFYAVGVWGTPRAGAEQVGVPNQRTGTGRIVLRGFLPTRP
jgi:hypothetical protein